MALNKATSAPKTNTPAFEAVDENTTDNSAESTRSAAQARLAEAAAKHQETQTAATSTAVAAKPTGAVAPMAAMTNPLEALKGAFHVEYDTLRNLNINQGNVIDKTTGKAMGDTIGLELLTYQDQWVVSPGVDGDEAKEHVRYSDDGITATDGTDMKAHLALLKQSGFADAKMSERLVIAGSVFEPGKLKDLKDSLVQINLPPTSRAAFKRYLMDQAFRVSKGLLSADGANRIKIECTIQKKGDNTWTVADFTRWVD